MSNFRPAIIANEKETNRIAAQRKAFEESGGVVQDLGIRKGPPEKVGRFNNAKFKIVK